MTRSIVLASASSWRLQLIRDAGLSCRAEPSQIDERTVQAAAPHETALARARAKALDVARRFPGEIVVGADQVADLDGAQFGKPVDDDEWLARLRQLRGRQHWLSTGVAVVRLPGPGAASSEVTVDESFCVRSGVTFRADLTDDELAAYVALGEARGCAGGYMVERRGAWLIESVQGDWLNVIGLPVLPLLGRLRALGWRLDREGSGVGASG